MHFFQSKEMSKLKTSYSWQWFENVQMYLCTFTSHCRQLMRLCITLNDYISTTVANITFSLLPVDSMHFSVHYGNCIKCISAFMHFYHSTNDLRQLRASREH